MALNFKTLALNAPTDCHVSMNFEFPLPLTILEFLEKVDILKLFENITYWMGARFAFLMLGVDSRDYYIERLVNVYLPLNHFKIEDVADLIQAEFERSMRFESLKECKVKYMNVSF